VEGEGVRGDCVGLGAMDNKKRIILILLIIVSIIFLLYWLAYQFGAGSYPYAEVYELNEPEQDVINAISQFKSENPDYIVPKGSLDLGESEGRRNNSHWFNNYFYYPQENQIVFTWTRPESKTKTKFAFVSLNDGLVLGHWKRVNKDFGFFLFSSENKRIKKQFEERILDKIKLKLKTY
jgi:hypothetical protein